MPVGKALDNDFFRYGSQIGTVQKEVVLRTNQGQIGTVQKDVVLRTTRVKWPGEHKTMLGLELGRDNLIGTRIAP